LAAILAISDTVPTDSGKLLRTDPDILIAGQNHPIRNKIILIRDLIV
jgi:hypothetical protein